MKMSLLMTGGCHLAFPSGKDLYYYGVIDNTDLYFLTITPLVMVLEFWWWGPTGFSWCGFYWSLWPIQRLSNDQCHGQRYVKLRTRIWAQ